MHSKFYGRKYYCRSDDPCGSKQWTEIRDDGVDQSWLFEQHNVELCRYCSEWLLNGNALETRIQSFNREWEYDAHAKVDWDSFYLCHGRGRNRSLVFVWGFGLYI